MLVLIADDNELNRDMLSRRLSRKGFQIAVAADGKEAVDQAVALNPKCILLDLNMPVMDGLEALKILKEETVTSSIPVICLTAASEGPQTEEALSLGAEQCISKPIAIDQLVEKISAFNRPSGAQ